MIGLVVDIVDEDCLKEVEVVDEDHLIKVEVVSEDCSMNVHVRFGTHHRQGLDHQI